MASKSNSAIDTAINPVGSAVNQAVGLAQSIDQMISGGYRERKEARQQQAWTELNAKQAHEYNMATIEAQQQWQDKMTQKYNTPKAQLKSQIEGMKEAGLNPAMLNGGAAGGGGSGAASQGGTPGQSGAQGARANSASAAAAKTAAISASTEATLTSQRVQSETELNRELAKKAKAEADRASEDAGLSKAKTDTENQMRGVLVAKAEEEGWEIFLRNFAKEVGWMTQVKDPRDKGGPNTETNIIKVGKFNRQFGYLSGPGSYLHEKVTNEILQAYAQTEEMQQSANKTQFEALIAEKDFDYYYNRLVNEIVRADAARIAATAYKLQTDYNVGNIWNAKQFVEMGSMGITALGGAIGNIWGAGMKSEQLKRIDKAAEEAKRTIEQWETSTTGPNGTTTTKGTRSKKY